MSTAPSPRLAGLDTLRALAIALVFMHHYQIFVSGTPTFGWAGTLGWVGVDLFFVLSGYLIADQLLAGLVRGQRLSLRAFYTRRALRTLPVFWVVLAAYFLWPTLMGGRTPPALWRFLTFTQNWLLPPGTAFSHAWSLCVEEQFYLVLPLALLVGIKLRATRWHGWALLAGLTAGGMATRAWLWTRYGLEADDAVAGYHPHLYYATIARADEFLPGVAVALLKHAHPQRWATLMQRGQALLVLGLLACAAMLTALLKGYYIDGYGYGFAMTTFGYSLGAMAFALLVMAALSPHSALARWSLPGARQLALWSYSIYLSHKAVGHIVKTQLAPADPTSGGLLLAVALASLAVGWALYRAVEMPFMALRRRWVPSNFPAATHRAHQAGATAPAA
ncbi:MAG: acyltransferase [Vitreoscilla sp.]|nr:acyltransferase [Burkholderiales bacterium]MBP6339209.1 acyltransferase [Vitreoscilla sp.]